MVVLHQEEIVHPTFKLKDRTIEIAPEHCGCSGAINSSRCPYILCRTCLSVP